MKKYVLDTSVIVYDVNCFFKFEENEVIIPITVLKELDGLKTEDSERGYFARRAIDIIDYVSTAGNIKNRVDLCLLNKEKLIKKEISEDEIGELKGSLKISFAGDTSFASNDEKIISCAKEEGAILVTRDKAMRILGRLSVQAEEYEADKVKVKKVYKGYREIYCHPDDITKLYSGRLEDTYDLFQNEFIILKSQENSLHTGVGIKKGEKIIPCEFNGEIAFKERRVEPYNLEQKMLSYLLLDEDIKCVTVIGASGKGKTLIPVDYALAKVKTKEYDRFIYTKSVISVDQREELGFYKGGIEEKLRPHLQPLYNSIEFLEKQKPYNGQKYSGNTEEQVNFLLENGMLDFQPLANIRGMSVMDKILMLDEAQNVSKHMVKSLVTRMSDTSKLIIAGDIDQIDSRDLNKYNNGLMHLIEKGKEESCVGHICLDITSKSKRGVLSEFGSRNL